MRLLLVSMALCSAASALDAQEATTVLHDDDSESEFVISIGPVDLPAAGHDHAAMAGAGGMENAQHEGMVHPPVAEVTFPRNAYLYGFRFELVDEQGNQLPSRLLHHLNIIDPHHRDLFLPISYRVAAVGSETRPMALPWMLFGQPVSAGQTLVVTSMLHNPTHTDYRGVTLRFIFDYVKTGRPWPLFSVYSFQIDVAFPAGDKDFDLPPGVSSRSWEGSPVVGGRIVAIGGHVHKHAVSLVLEDVTAGRTIWEGEPILDEQGAVTGVTLGRLYRRFGVRIFPDRRYRVTVTYDNPTGDTLPEGGMGVVGGLFIPEVDEWPLADARDELYRLDRQHYMREVHGTMDDIMRSDSTPMAGHQHGGRSGGAR